MSKKHLKRDIEEMLLIVERDFGGVGPYLESLRNEDGSLPAYGEHEIGFNAGYAYGCQETRRFVIQYLKDILNGH